MIHHAPDRFLDELQAQLESQQKVRASVATISRHLKEMGYTMKQVSRVRSRVFFVRGRRYASQALSSIQPMLTRCDRWSVLPALSLDGILALKIVEGSFDAISFMEFVELCLLNMNPYPARNSVLVMDNCRIHKSALIREMVESK
ncbi:hypothetical protein CALVIDRAFT_487323 [Calocera viscosa TUFC12733]|nr:hypothetical protein CALVIDRAFT_487323 [Calocera viscosa TUFC12733]